MKKIIIISACIILFSLNNVFSQSGWIKKSIGFYYDVFNTLKFFNQNTGIVISGYSGIPGYYGRLFKTTNGGQNWWTHQTFTTGATYINGYYFNESNFILVGQMNSGFGFVAVYYNNIRNDYMIPPTSGYQTTFIVSTDWINSDTGFIAGFDFLPSHCGRVLKTTNRGVNWIEITPTPYSSDVSCVKFVNYNTGYIVDNGSFLKTTNSGLNWLQISSVSLTELSLQLVTKDTFYITGDNGGVKISCDSGYTWQSRPVGYNVLLRSLAFVNSKTGWVCGDSGYIFRTTNAGVNWQRQNSGTKVRLCRINIVDQNNVWIGCDSGLVLKTTTGGVTFIENEENETTNAFQLHQNYPNPFNPSTTISYYLIKNNYIKLKVFDITGKLVTTLVDKYQNKGEYKIDFSAEYYNLCSGIYFYKLEAGDYNNVKKMIILK